MSTRRELSCSLRPHVLLYGLDEAGHLLLLGPGARAHPALRAVAGLVLQARDAVGEVRARVAQDHEALLRAEAQAAHGADTCKQTCQRCLTVFGMESTILERRRLLVTSPSRMRLQLLKQIEIGTHVHKDILKDL